jgi:hypothetical protein
MQLPSQEFVCGIDVTGWGCLKVCVVCCGVMAVVPMCSVMQK